MKVHKSMLMSVPAKLLLWSIKDEGSNAKEGRALRTFILHPILISSCNYFAALGLHDTSSGYEVQIVGLKLQCTRHLRDIFGKQCTPVLMYINQFFCFYKPSPLCIHAIARPSKLYVIAKKWYSCIGMCILCFCWHSHCSSFELIPISIWGLRKQPYS